MSPSNHTATHSLPTPIILLRTANRESLERLGEAITELTAHLDAGTYQLLKLIEQFDREGGWHGTGIATCAHWLNWQCGMGMNTARERVRVARALPDLPLISAAFESGRVSFSKVRAMSRVATPENEEILLNIALHGTANHVETIVRQYRACKRNDALNAENLRHQQRCLSWYVDDDGSWVIKGRLTPEQGALISTALDAATEMLYQEHKDEPEAVAEQQQQVADWSQPMADTLTARRTDALERMARTFLAGNEATLSGGDRYLVNIHTNIDTLKVDGSGAEAELEGQANVSAETSRRLACDAAVLHLLEDADGNPLNVGRKTRTIPPAIRRALQRRDGGCVFPGCSCRRFVDAHHIQHWADGGETSMDNLTLLCRRHHRLVHEEGFGINKIPGEKPGQAIVFTLPNGEVLPHNPASCSEKCFRGNIAVIQANNRANGREITPHTAVPLWYGERMDHNIVLDGLWRADQP